MRKTIILQGVAWWGCYFLLGISGVDSNGLGETKQLYQPLSEEKDQTAVQKVIKDYYGQLYEKYKSPKFPEISRMPSMAEGPDRSRTFMAPPSESEMEMMAVEPDRSKMESMIEEQDDLNPLRMQQIKQSGFQALEEIQKAQPKVDAPLAVTYVGLDALKKFGENDSPESLIVSTGSYYVAIEQKDPKATPVAVLVQPSKAGATPKIIQSGPSRIFQLLAAGVKDIVEKDYKSEDLKYRIFAIAIPSAKQFFLGDQTSGEFKIKVLTDGPGEFKRNQLVSAKKVFMELAKEAKAQNFDFPEFLPQRIQRRRQ